ncbi:MAG: hypothetical protein BGO31_10525 [Bacteroidetes bacterium 43-16]|nr:MAG: hypothetical protein BGO31_10525 [Bacteroidetes bacterium 43-16]
MKQLIFLSLALPGIVACNKDKKKTPEEYFSFYADGVYYDYPQEKGSSLFVDWKTLSAGASSASVGYQIYAYSRKNPVADGFFSFIFSGNHIPSQDTILLDGVSNVVGIGKFNAMENNYELKQPLSGKIIFTERTSDKLTGIFAFDAYKMRVEGNNWVPTDSIIHITEGKFSIIPSN